MFRKATIAAVTTAALIATPAASQAQVSVPDQATPEQPAISIGVLATGGASLDITQPPAPALPVPAVPAAPAAPSVGGVTPQATPAPSAAERKLRSARRVYRVRYDKAKRKLGHDAVGRDIARHGVVRNGHTRPATTVELKRSSQRLHGMTRQPKQVAGPAVSTTTSALLERIAQCESGGDPTAVSPGGTYRGKYQFSVTTWQAIGGSGDPAAAPEAVQDAMAAKLLATAGPGQWPVCGA